MEPRINARAASLQSPRPFKSYPSTGKKLSPKSREPLTVGKNGRLVTTYTRSPSKSPTNSLMREKLRRNPSFEIAGGPVPKSLSAPDVTAIDSDINGTEDQGRRRTAMMPVSNSTSTWKIAKNSRCLVNPDPLFGVYFNKNGEMYTSSETPKGGQLQCFDRNGNCLRNFFLKPYGKNSTKTFQPYQIHEAPDGHIVVACGTSVTVWSKEGKLMFEHGKNMFKFCKNVAVRSTGEIIATDSDSDCVRIISCNGQQITKLDCKIECAAGVAVDSNDNIIVTDWKHKIRVFDVDNNLIRSFGQRGNGDGELDMVYGVCTDAEDNIVVADMWNERVSVYSNEGKFITNIATGASSGIHRPFHLAVTKGDNDDNRLAVIEFGGSEVKLLSY